MVLLKYENEEFKKAHTPKRFKKAYVLIWETH